MKLDKEIVIAVILCGILLFGWNPFCVYMGWMPDPKAAPAKTAPAAPVAPAAPAPAAPQTIPAAAPAAPEAAPALPVPQAEPVTLANDVMRLSLDPLTGGITAIELKDFHRADKSKGLVVIDQVPSRVTGAPLQPGALGITLEGWQRQLVAQEATADGCALTYRCTDAAGHAFDLVQSVTLTKGYAIDMKAAFRNLGTAPLSCRLTVSDGELLPWEKVSGDTLRSDSLKLDYCTMAMGGSLSDVAADAKDSKFFRKASDLRWVSLSNKYFISMLKGEQPFELALNRARSGEQLFVTAGAACEIALPAGSGTTLDFALYAGPKIASNLEAFSPNAARTMHLAWGPLDYLARFLLWALIGLKSICGSYGWSIVLLTVIVRLVFWPVTAKANASMRRMSELQPRIKALRDQYKDNPQMLNAKTMELYRQEKVNPLGGCLPILLQIPVFFALYATLDGAIQLRQVSFLWAQDLAAPDTVCRLPGYLLGLPINPLVLAMTLLMVLQQKLTPSAMDPTQQKMMMIMPVVMLFMLYNLPSGLTLYWTVSQIFSILQMILQKRSVFSRKEQPAAAAGKQG